MLLHSNKIQCNPWADEFFPTTLKRSRVNFNLTTTAGVGWNAEAAPEKVGGARSQTLSEQR
jgi:hypothetical protein